MLDELQVSNLGLIAEASVEPGAGLVVFSGETGAGKTLLLGALRLLTGEPARRDRVGPAAAEAAVSGRFLLPAGDELIVRRKVAAGGRSRAYIDDTMVGALTEVTKSLPNAIPEKFRWLLPAYRQTTIEAGMISTTPELEPDDISVTENQINHDIIARYAVVSRTLDDLSGHIKADIDVGGNLAGLVELM